MQYKIVRAASKLPDLTAEDAVSIDLELTGLDLNDQIIGVAISTYTDNWFVVVDHPDAKLSVSMIKFKKWIENLVAKADPVFVLHNAEFDIRRLAVHDINLTNYVCTMVLAYVYYPGCRSYGMDNLARELMNLSTISYKSLVNEKKGETLQDVPLGKLAEYAAEDTAVTMALYQKIMSRKEVLNCAQLDQLAKDDAVLKKVTTDIEERGMRVDTDKLQVLYSEFEDIRGELLDDIRHIAQNDELNPKSSKQLREVLFGDEDEGGLGLTPITHTKTGNPSTDAATLAKLDHPIADKISEYNSIGTLVSSFCKTLPILADEDGRVRGRFNFTGTVTGRASSAKPNLQNIPTRTELGAKIRSCFVPDPGNVLIVADYSGIEQRVLADWAQVPAMLDVFHEGGDLHQMTADDLGIERRVAKTVGFGIVYGQTGYGLAQTLSISEKEANEIVDAYMSAYPEVGKFMQRAINFAKRNGYTQTLAGRRIPLPGIKNKTRYGRASAERRAYNGAIQGTAADIMRRAIVNAVDVPVIATVHDELVVEVPKSSNVEEIQQEVVDLMVEAGDYYIHSCPITVDSKICMNWAEGK